MRMPRLREIALAVAFLTLAAGCGRKVDSKTKEGYDLVTAGKLDEAIALANSVLADDPQHTGALNVLGLALYKSGDMPAAMGTFQKALEIDPKHPEVHFNLGNVYLTLKRFPEAEKEYDAAVEAEDKFVLARYNLGKVYEQTGRVDQALTQYRRTVDLDPQFFPGYMDIGRILETSGDIDGSITNYKRALELQPAIKELRVRLGNSYMKKGGPENLKLAEEEYRAAAGIDSDVCGCALQHGCGADRRRTRGRRGELVSARAARFRRRGERDHEHHPAILPREGHPRRRAGQRGSSRTGRYGYDEGGTASDDVVEGQLLTTSFDPGSAEGGLVILAMTGMFAFRSLID